MDLYGITVVNVEISFNLIILSHGFSHLYGTLLPKAEKGNVQILQRSIISLVFTFWLQWKKTKYDFKGGAE